MIAVTGANGQLGTAFRRLLGSKARYLTRGDLDLRDIASIGSVLDRLRPSTLINCAAYTAVDAAETDEETARIVNAEAVEEMAVWCARNGARFVTFSTDYVFDGTLGRPYVESDKICPINAYGRTKAEGERRALAANPDALVIRTSWLFSSTHPNFVSEILELAHRGPVEVVDDQTGSPTSVEDLVDRTVRVFGLGAVGLLHISNRGEATWFELARSAVEIAGMNPERVVPASTDASSQSARRPRYSVLGCGRLERLGLDAMPPWDQSLESVVRGLEADVT